MSQQPQYTYFISYSHAHGFGHTTLATYKPLTTRAMVKEIQQWLKENQPIKDPVLLNWIPLDS